ncbi:hypothetical protein [Conchiformibius steedae]|uniref:Uncharacterized protein n=1 Tax=Conchiformibius steedae TaxID=153493 RepID=A0A3P2A3Z3_9NEIS|nr:hypothetical protein [Conchiformibius steedae]RRD89606.1 hypothetical protein EII21_08240 [Conchiformibius steedae]
MDSSVMDMPLTWRQTYNIDFPYQTEINQQTYFLRLNNFPDENLYTLVDEMLSPCLELEDLPINWTMETV